MGVNKVFSRFKLALSDHNTEVEITRNYLFDYQRVIHKIELYRSSRFLSGDRDSEGQKKYFFNICNAQAGNVTKNIDLDVKDVLFRSKSGTDRLKSTILTEVFRYWAKKHKFSLLLNEISEQLPIWGHVVLRKYKDKIKRLELRDVMWDQSVKSIHQSPYLIFRHYFQPWELDKMVEKGWDREAIAKINDHARKAKASDVLVYEYMGEFPNEWLGKKGKGWNKGVFFLATTQNQLNYNDDSKQGQKRVQIEEILFREEIDKYPVKELKMFDVDGRALGLGIFELLFDMQERKNEMGNQKASSMRVSSKNVFQTRDKLVQSNIMDDVINGEIMKVTSEITPIQNQEKNLQAFAQEEGNLNSMVRNIANAQEITLGETMPSGTPFRLGALLQQNASALFGFLREKYGMLVEEMVEDWIMPDFTPEAVKNQILEVQDQDLIEQVNERDINRRVNNVQKSVVIDSGRFLSPQEITALKDYMRTMNEPTPFIDIAEGFLDFEYDIDVVVTDEKENTEQKVETLSNFLQLAGQNPTILEDPRLKKPLNELLEKTGVSSRVSAKAPAGTAPQPSLSEVAQGRSPNAPVSGTGGQPAKL